MTDKPKPAPHPAAGATTHAHPPKKPGRTTPPRAPMPSVKAHPDAAPNKGRIAAAVGVTLAAGALIGRAVFGLAGKMLRRRR